MTEPRDNSVPRRANKQKRKHGLEPVRTHWSPDCPASTAISGSARPALALILATIAAVCAGLYAWTADFPLVFDDHLYIAGNPFLLEPGGLALLAHPSEIVRTAERLRIDPDIATNLVLRPVAYATLRLNVLLDGLTPRWFRVVNITVHAGNSALVFLLLRRLLQRNPVPVGELRQHSSIFIPAVASLLFAAHPLATESVTYIIQRFTSLGTFFYLLSLWLFFKSADHHARTGVVWKWRIPAMIATGLGMLTKECVVTLPLAAVMLDVIANDTHLRLAVRRAWPLLTFLPLVPGLVILASTLRHSGTGGLAAAINLVNASENPLRHHEYLVTQITVVAAYMHRILWPDGLNVNPDWPLHHSLFERPVLLAILELAAIVTVIVFVWRRHRHDPRARLALSGIVWFFLTVSVSSGLVPLPDLMAEHRSYLPSIGIFTVIACTLDAVRTTARLPLSITRTLAPASALLCIAALGTLTCLRNETWRTRESLWKDSVEKSPRNARSWASLGAAYADSGRDHEAVECFREALSIKPRDESSMFNLSNSLLRLNQPHEALETMRDLVDANQRAAGDPPVAYTLGLAYASVGDLDHAVPIMKQVIETAPGNAMAHIALARIYMSSDQPGKALNHFRVATTLGVTDESLRASIKAAEAALGQPPPTQ